MITRERTDLASVQFQLVGEKTTLVGTEGTDHLSVLRAQVVLQGDHRPVVLNLMARVALFVDLAVRNVGVADGTAHNQQV